MNTSSTDRIERQILLKAPRAKVWHALTDAESFGQWFGVKFEGQRFIPGEVTQGAITYPGFEHLLMQVLVRELQPQRLFSFNWHPYAVDPAIDYSSEEPTLVEFMLEEVDGGTLLRTVESGFDKVPAARREEAFRMNCGGWDEQIGNIERYVS